MSNVFVVSSTSGYDNIISILILFTSFSRNFESLTILFYLNLKIWGNILFTGKNLFKTKKRSSYKRLHCNHHSLDMNLGTSLGTSFGMSLGMSLGVA